MSPTDSQPAEQITLNSRRRRRYWWCVLVLLIVLQPVLPSFPTLDFILLDFYHRHFHSQTPSANTEIVHVHIDDQALKTVGRFPWNREKLALVVDELDKAGARFIVLDLLLDDPQVPHIVKQFDPTTGQEKLVEIDGDAQLARSMRTANNVILPIYFKQYTAPEAQDISDPIAPSVLEKLPAVEIGTEVVDTIPQSEVVIPVESLVDASIAFGGVTVDFDSDGRVRHIPLLYRHQDQMFPHLSVVIASKIKFDQDYKISTPGNMDTLRIASKADQQSSDITATRMTIKGVALKDSKLDHSRFHFPLTWPNGDSNWRLFYQLNNKPTQQLNIGRVIELAQFRDNRHTNQIQIDRAYLEIAKRIRPALVNRYQNWFNNLHVAHSSEASNESKSKLIQSRARLQQPIKEALDLILPQLATADLTTEEKQLKQDLIKLKQLITQTADINNQLTVNIAREELALKNQIQNKTAIVGWTALGSIADFLPTSLHDKCPGSIIISSATNAILTDHMLRSNPFVGFTTSSLLILLGFLAAIYLRPVFSLITILGLQAGYALFTGWVIFDIGNILFYSAQPMLIAALLWTAILIYRLFTEEKDKARITRQFSHYLAPSLVKLLVEKPESIVRGHHELSCAFIDIEQFTRIADELGAESTVPLLNTYLRRLTQHLMVRDTYVNKYLGDGILAIWGAPIRSTTYAKDAASAILGCMEAVNTLNQEQMQSETPDLRIRASITTGFMMIDDFGAPPLRTDYTIIGSPVNLAARLEQANKAFGTRILIDQQTHEYIHDEFLTRYIGLIRITGLHEPHHVYELVAFKHLATDEQIEYAELTSMAIEKFTQGDFLASTELFNRIESLSGSTPLIRLYLHQCEQYFKSGKPDDFDGSLHISTKA